MIINMNGAKAPETPSPVLQEKTVTPQTLPTVIGADEGYDGLSQVTVNPDSQLRAENIRSGKTIFGVDGTFVGAESSSQLLKAIYANMKADGSYVETLDTSNFSEDVGQPEVSSDKLMKFLSLGVSVKTLFVNNVNTSKIVVNGGTVREGGTSHTTPAKVVVTETTSSYTTGTTLEGTILGFPEIPSGGNSRFLAEKITANIAVSGDMVIDDTHWFVNSFYCGYNGANLTYLNPDGTIGGTSSTPVVIHFKRNDSSISPYTLWFYNKYSVRFYSETPPSLQNADVFNKNNLQQLIVPKGLLETYQNASGWSAYADKIVEAPE